jgi:hypothetical protein
MHVVHERGRNLGRAGRWLVADLRERLKGCPGVALNGDIKKSAPALADADLVS